MNGTHPVDLLQLRDGVQAHGRDHVAVEAPIALLYNGDPFAVMMATPVDLADFALGFTLSEGIVAQPDQCRIVDVLERDGGIAVHCAIPQACFDALGARRRNLEGRSGCGLCGAESLQAALRPIPASADTHGARTISARQVHRAMQHLQQSQPLNARCGGLHAAAWLPLSRHGTAAASATVREDVGRHNALDKAIGAVAGAGGFGQAAVALLTSRASYELVHKAATAGAVALAAISAPTSLAIALAERAGLTLMAFVREGGMNVYTHGRRITDDQALADDL